MERIYLGNGVFRAEDNTMIYEVYSPEQMEAMRANTCYQYMKENKLKGGFHGMKVLGHYNTHGALIWENIDRVLPEQKQIILDTWSQVDPPVQVWDGEVYKGLNHDVSKNKNLAKEADFPNKRGEGINKSNVNPSTGEVDDDDHEELDESFLGGDDDAESDGSGEDESGAVAKTGNASGGNKQKKSTGGKRPAQRTNKK